MQVAFPQELLLGLRVDDKHGSGGTLDMLRINTDIDLI